MANASKNLVAVSAASVPARIQAPVPSTRRNGSVQPHKTVLHGTVSAVSASEQYEDETASKGSFLTRYSRLITSLYFFGSIALVALVPGGSAVKLLVGLALLIFTIVVAIVVGVKLHKAEAKADAEREDDRVQRKEAYDLQRADRLAEREADRIQRKADYEATRHLRDLEQKLKVATAALNAQAAYVRAQRAANGTRRY